MIILTKMNDEEFALNCDLIETIYEKPDTTIYLTNGKLYIVKEPMAEVVEKAIAYHREVFRNILNDQF